MNRFQIKGTYNINKQWSANAGYAYEKYDYNDGQMAGYGSYYGYFQNLNTAAVGSNYSWLTGAFANPGLHDEPGLADRDLQVRPAAAVPRRRR